MAIRTLPALTVAVAIIAGGIHGAQAPAEAKPFSCTRGDADRVEYFYSLSARVRPLLFWIGKDNVGGARIARSTRPVRRYELLIGSAPARTPRRINRWGYIAESLCDGAAEQLGVMTESSEATIQDADRRTSGAGAGRYRFQAIRSFVESQDARAATHLITLADDLTYRDLEQLLARVPTEGGSIKHVRLPDGTAPGFLAAVAELLHDSVESLQRAGRPERNLRRAYVHHGTFYDLRVASSEPIPQIEVEGITYARAIETEFENRNRRTGKTSTFRILFGTSGRLREIPIRIVYRPRWWFEAELRLTGERHLR